MAVEWVAFPLHPDTPAEGRSLEALFRGRDFDLEAARLHLQQEAGRLGLPFGDRRMTYNSRKAQELGKWAHSLGKGDAFHLAIFKAYFVHGRNISQLDELMAVCQEIGLGRAAAADALEDPRYAAAVDRDWHRSRANGITAAPTFVAAGRRLVGAHPYAAIESLVVAAGAIKAAGASKAAGAAKTSQGMNGK